MPFRPLLLKYNFNSGINNSYVALSNKLIFFQNSPLPFRNFAVAWVMKELKINNPEVASIRILQAAIDYIKLHKSYFGTYNFQVNNCREVIFIFLL
jgi:hypothetical protein